MYVIIRYYHKQSYCLLKYTEPKGVVYGVLLTYFVVVCVIHNAWTKCVTRGKLKYSPNSVGISILHTIRIHTL